MVVDSSHTNQPTQGFETTTKMASSQSMELKAKYDFVKFLLRDIIITITCYGNGEVFPQMVQVVLYLNDTVEDLKDLIINQAEDDGFNISIMERIDPAEVYIGFQDDLDQPLYYYRDGTKLMDFDSLPRYAILSHYL